MTLHRKKCCFLLFSLIATIYLIFTAQLSLASIEDDFLVALSNNDIEVVQKFLDKDINIKRAIKILGPDNFLSQAYRLDCSNKPENLKLKLDLMIQALKEGGDPNNIITNDLTNAENILLFGKSEATEILFNNSYKKLNPELFCQQLKKNRHGINKSYYYSPNPKDEAAKILETEHKNLDAKPGPSPKIPRILHHIWLTNEKIRKEISEEDIENVLKTMKLFSQNGKNWEHIVWTNDKNLIPSSTKKLEENGIKVKEISEINNHFILRNKLNELIERKLWGMASDVLRYEILKHLGGVYADLNYIFKRNVELEIHTYDFFNTYLENYFIACKPNHPILIDLVNLVYENFYNTSPDILSLDIEECTTTDAITYAPLSDAYYRTANKNGTIDVIYPKLQSKLGDKKFVKLREKEELNRQANKEVLLKYTKCPEAIIPPKSKYDFMADNGICGAVSMNFGDDNKYRNIKSWMNDLDEGKNL